jgi:hypothetical protein
MHSLRLIGLGLFFALAGIALFAFTLRKAGASATAGTPGQPMKKSELRALEAQQAENNKLRIAAALAVVIGAVLMLLS